MSDDGGHPRACFPNRWWCASWRCDRRHWSCSVGSAGRKYLRHGPSRKVLVSAGKSAKWTLPPQRRREQAPSLQLKSNPHFSELSAEERATAMAALMSIGMSGNGARIGSVLPTHRDAVGEPAVHAFEGMPIDAGGSFLCHDTLLQPLSRRRPQLEHAGQQRIPRARRDAAGADHTARAAPLTTVAVAWLTCMSLSPPTPAPQTLRAGLL